MLLCVGFDPRQVPATPRAKTVCAVRLSWAMGIGQIYQDLYARAWRIEVRTRSDQARFAIWYFVPPLRQRSGLASLPLCASCGVGRSVAPYRLSGHALPPSVFVTAKDASSSAGEQRLRDMPGEGIT